MVKKWVFNGLLNWYYRSIRLKLNFQQRPLVNYPRELSAGSGFSTNQAFFYQKIAGKFQTNYLVDYNTIPDEYNPEETT